MSSPRDRRAGAGRGRPQPPTQAPPELPLPRKTARKIGPRPQGGDHVGLWIDKLLPRAAQSFTLKGTDRHEVLGQLCRSYQSQLGAEVIERARQAAAEVHVAHRILRASLQWRLLVDVGRVNAVETSVSLHPIWGVPRIPGSALKGATRARMVQEAADPKRIERCLGERTAAGSLVFYDALPEHGDFKLGLDVLTPHAKEYYEKQATPGDWLSPEPHTFLTVESAGRRPSVFVFLVGVDVHAIEDETPEQRKQREAEAERDLEVAVKALQDLLLEDGIGAKTVAGYGRFQTLDVRSGP